MPDLMILVLWAATAALLLTAVWHDVVLRIIPNRVPFLIAVLGLLLRAAEGQLLVSLPLAAAVFIVGALCWRQGFLGGGDVKLLAACVLMLPPGASAAFLLTTALAGGVLAAVYIALGRLPSRLFIELPGRTLAARIWRIERQRIREGGPLPYACAICAGAVVTACGS
jgi:prepilin peptidase CpaA